jgi:hypothetical protein
MIVRCLTTTAGGLSAYAYDSRRGITPETEYPVTPGRDYHVVAITILQGHARYYIHDDDDLAWPIWTPASVFEIIDGHLPASWIVGYFRFAPDNQHPLISFPEWALDHYFYERLVDGEPDAVQTYAFRRAEAEAG